MKIHGVYGSLLEPSVVIIPENLDMAYLQLEAGGRGTESHLVAIFASSILGVLFLFLFYFEGWLSRRENIIDGGGCVLEVG